MLSRCLTRSLLALVVSAADHLSAQQQDSAAVPCQQQTCGLSVEWRGPVPAFADRRYGAPTSFETVLRARLVEAGYRFAPALLDADATNLRLVPEMTRAICDQTPGTGTDRSCQTIGSVNVEIRNVDPSLEINDVLRIRANCGADQLMEIVVMAEYVAATIDYELHQREGRERPRTRC